MSAQTMTSTYSLVELGETTTLAQGTGLRLLSNIRCWSLQRIGLLLVRKAIRGVSPD